MENNIQEIVTLVEDKIMSSRSNKRRAVILFRDQKCLRDDFRTAEIVEETFGIMIMAFIKETGRTNLTKTLIKVGEMIARRFNIEANKATAAQLGTLIIEQMIIADYLILMQEPFFTFDDIAINGKKTTVRSQGYILEIGPKFVGIKFADKVRTGIQLYRYTPWASGSRIVDGMHHVLTKYYGDQPLVRGDEAYLRAVNNLEQVRWEVNPKIAEVSELLIESISDTTIRLDEGIKFNVTDVKRLTANKHLAGKELFLNGAPFRPEKGNSLSPDTLEIGLNKLNRRISRLAEGGRVQLEAIAEYKKISKTYEIVNADWQAKQLCLAKQSKVARDISILDTITKWKDSKFYLGMFLDFRGRMYAKDPYFSYQSSDLARGHLMFAEKKLMTSKGYRNLLLHIANSFNKSYEVSELADLDWLELDYKTDLIADGIPSIAVDKMSINDRVQWAEENLVLFLDVAEDPIGALKIWQGAEKPWVFLSLCFEVVNYLTADGDYYSQMPIAIDGASNGTQHLAAMSRDEVAGKMVGLTALDKPIDFYIEVAKGILNRNVGTDLGKVLAGIPMKLIRKGISKRGTMTRAYDAGVRCIADIIYTDCYNAKMTKKYGITKDIAFKLARNLVDTYNELCQGPVEIKDYLQALVKYQLETEDVITWTTPSDFPVVSERWCWNKAKTYVYMQGKKIGLIIRENTGVTAKADISSGISPNWVHSMDASHMAMVINILNKKGVKSFGAIHDSFSVHAEDVNLLLEVTKEAFIDMYSYDMFNYMARQITKTENMLDICPPKLGKLDLEGIRDSDYFFS